MKLGRKLITQEEIETQVTKMAFRVSTDYSDKELFVLGVRDGGMPFYWLLLKQLICSWTASTVTASSYEGTTSTEKVQLTKFDFSTASRRDVLVLDDIIDTGNTLSSIINAFRGVPVKSLRVGVLLNKPSCRNSNCLWVDSQISYMGFALPNAFVVGYGLDYNDEYRELKDIHVMEGEEEGK